MATTKTKKGMKRTKTNKPIGYDGTLLKAGDAVESWDILLDRKHEMGVITALCPKPRQGCIEVKCVSDGYVWRSAASLWKKR